MFVFTSVRKRMAGSYIDYYHEVNVGTDDYEFVNDYDEGNSNEEYIDFKAIFRKCMERMTVPIVIWMMTSVMTSMMKIPLLINSVTQSDKWDGVKLKKHFKITRVRN